MSRAREIADLGSPAASGLSNRNLVINGAMTINQRGTQTGVRNSYGVDRFQIAGVGAQLFTYSQSTTVPSGQGFSYSTKLDVTTADTSLAAGDYVLFRQRFEGQDFQHLKYGTSDAESLTLQFWVRSPKTGTHIVELYHQDAAYVNGQAYTITSANTWQKVVVTFVGYQTTAITNDNTVGFAVQWWLMAGSTYSSGTLASNTWHNVTSGAANRAVGQVNVVDSTSNEFYITGVQLEVGDGPATPFEHRTFGDDLAACQRYFQKSYDYGTAIGTNTTVSAMFHRNPEAVSNRTPNITFPVEMRAATTTVVYSIPGTANAASNCNTGFTHSSDITSTNFSGTDGTHGLSRLGLGQGVDDIVGFHYTADAEL